MGSEDLDQLVECCADKLLSDDPFDVLIGILKLNKAHASEPDKTEFFRKAQELAVFKGGSVLRVLLGRVADVIKEAENRTRARMFGEALSQSDGRVAPHDDRSRKDLLTFLSLQGLLELSRSKVAVEGFMRVDASSAENLAMFFASGFIHGLRELFISEKEKGRKLVETNLNGLVNFSRSARVFREAVRELPGLPKLFKELELICTKSFLVRLEDGEWSQLLKILVSSLMLSLSFAPDSQVWAVENGLLRVVAAVYESTHRRELSALLGTGGERARSPAFRCNMALLNLVESEASRNKLKQVDCLSLLKAHKTIINSVQPDLEPWWYLKVKVSGKLESSSAGSEVPILAWVKAPDWKRLRRMICGLYPEQTVCSWKLCNAGSELDERIESSRCARCQLARYCSKEHQKLHWRTHKKHCWAMPAIADAEEGGPESA